MKYRRFGRTELQIPVFTCGGMRYQYKWQDVSYREIPADNQKNLEATIHRSLELGINHIETARAYGTSELQLGKVLPQFDRDSLIVQTKIEPMTDSKSFLKTFEQSLRFLNLDYVDLLSIHGINLESHLEECLRPGGCFEVAQKLQAQGKVRSIGFSTHGPVDVIVKTIATNQFDYVNLHWYYINQVNWAAIAAANQLDMGVFIISPSNKGGLLYNPSPRLVDLCMPLSPIVFNNLFCLSHPQVHTLSIGAARPEDFDEHLKTLEVLDRADEFLPPILQRLEEAAIERLGSYWVSTWRTGLPSVDETPGRLNIPIILWLRNLAIAYDMVDYAKMRYNLLGQASHWFPGARADTIDPNSLRKCLANSPHADKIPDLLQEAHEMLGGEIVKRMGSS